MGGIASKVSARDPIIRPATTGLADIVPDPLFKELFSNIAGPKRFLYYGWQYDKAHTRVYRARAKRFGIRYVIDEQLDEAVKYNLICRCRNKMSEAGYKKRGIPLYSKPIKRPRKMPPISLPAGLGSPAK